MVTDWATEVPDAFAAVKLGVKVPLEPGIPVNAPLAVTWAQGKNMDFYVASAGGYSRDADKGRAYVTQPSGKVESVHRRFLLPDGKPEPAAGATIFVPEKDKTKAPANTLQILATAATILASLATIIIVARQN